MHVAALQLSFLSCVSRFSPVLSVSRFQIAFAPFSLAHGVVLQVVCLASVTHILPVGIDTNMRWYPTLSSHVLAEANVAGRCAHLVR